MGSGRDDFERHALETPFDNDTNGFVSEEVQGAIEEIANTVSTTASPGFTWGKGGNVAANTWLLNDSVPSNKAGRRIFVSNATLEALFVSSENVDTYDVEVYEHNGTTYTLITTVSVVAQRGAEFTIASLPLTTGYELALKVVNGSAKNPVAGAVIKGSF